MRSHIISSSTRPRYGRRRRSFGVSKSTIHKDVTDRLLQINPSLAAEARKVLDVNKSERHIRGGLGHAGEVSAPARLEHFHAPFPDLFTISSKYISCISL